METKTFPVNETITEKRFRPVALVAGRNYCSILCMARSLGQAGYPVEVLRITETKPRTRNLMARLKPDACSKYVTKWTELITDRDAERIFTELARLADPSEKKLLVPVDDLVAETADRHLDALKDRYYMANVRGEEGALAALMSKERQKELAEEAGLPLLRSVVLTAEDGVFSLPENVPYPCFLKPNISKDSSKNAMRICRDEEELTAALTELSRGGRVSVLAEEYAKVKTEISILGLCAGGIAIGPGLFFATENGGGEHRGVALMGRMEDPAKLGDLHGKILRFLSGLGYDGLFDVDLIETEDGSIFFLEVNLRYGASGYGVTALGVNLPGMWADHLVFGDPIDTEARLKEYGGEFLSEKILIDEYVKNRVDKDTVDRLMARADIRFIEDEEDPAPYDHFKKFWKVASIRRKL